jgi:hypothetical protein
VNYLPGLASNLDPPDLCLLSSWDYRREPLPPAKCLDFAWQCGWPAFKYARMGASGGTAEMPILFSEDEGSWKSQPAILHTRSKSSLSPSAGLRARCINCFDDNFHPQPYVLQYSDLLSFY